MSFSIESDPFDFDPDDESIISEPESLCNNWRGWKKTQSSGFGVRAQSTANYQLQNFLGSGPQGINSVAFYDLIDASRQHEILRRKENAGLVSAGLNVGLVNPQSLICNVDGPISNLPMSISPQLIEQSHRPSSPTVSVLKSIYQAESSSVMTLMDLASRTVAKHIPFEVVENYHVPVPEQLQMRIAFWSFPTSEDDIRLYSCLANGSGEEFQKGELLYKSKAVMNALQIGFHLSAFILSNSTTKSFNVAITFDQNRITKSTCTCSTLSSFCSHIVAACLHRIYQPHTISLRIPVSESLRNLSLMNEQRLLKFAQYLISAFPHQILPTAQKLLDELLLNEQSVINRVNGAPDPTTGCSIDDQTKWVLDEIRLHEAIRKIIIKLCAPSPIVYSDVLNLSSTAPPAVTEWTILLRPLRGREPEGLWNLFSIIREMLQRHDRNAIPLLNIITEEVLSSDQVVIWWFTNNVALQRGVPPNAHWSYINQNPQAGGQNNRFNNSSSIHSNAYTSQHVSSSLCEEIVSLWRLIALNPALTKEETFKLCEQLRNYHLETLAIVIKCRQTAATSNNFSHSSTHNNQLNKLPDIVVFTGFKPAIMSCSIDWQNYPVQGVTSHFNSRYSGPYFVAEEDVKPDEFDIFRGMDELTIEDNPRQREPSPESDGISSDDEEQARPNPPESNEQGMQHNYSMYFSGGSLRGRSAFKQRPRDWYMKDKAIKRWHKEMLQATSTDANLPNEEFEILFARAEALYAHGFVREASTLSNELGKRLLDNPPRLQLDTNHTVSVPMENVKHSKRGRHRFNPALHKISLEASATLSKASFLCQVLSEDRSSHLLAFKVGIFGLELIRPPASTKALEVKLATQEQDLANLLRRIPLCQSSLAILRKKAEALRDGQLSRGDVLLPLTLASYIFDSLCRPIKSSEYCVVSSNVPITNSDEKLGYQAAVAAIGQKANVAEADHPLLCEGTRRQRGELVLSMLVHYKDNKERLHKILQKFLDKGDDAKTPQEIAATIKKAEEAATHACEPGTSGTQKTPAKNKSLKSNEKSKKSGSDNSDSSPAVNKNEESPARIQRSDSSSDSSDSFSEKPVQDSAKESSSSSSGFENSSNSPSRNSSINNIFNEPTSSSSLQNLPSNPEDVPQFVRMQNSKSNYNYMNQSHSQQKFKYKGKRGQYPQIPNKPSEASAHFMFELAKTVLNKAGGNNSSALFTNPTNQGSREAPHRNLHMCAFQIGLHSLGLLNAVTPNWLSRNYSSHVTWIQTQAMEIGHQAIVHIIDTWKDNLTPQEVAALADQASRKTEPAMIKAGAELSLSCLPHSHALTPSQIQRALVQCKEQSRDMLQKACLTIETAAYSDGIYPEVLFDVARKWYDLYLEESGSLPESNRNANESVEHRWPANDHQTESENSSNQNSLSVSLPLLEQNLEAYPMGYSDPLFGAINPMIQLNPMYDPQYLRSLGFHFPPNVAQMNAGQQFAYPVPGYWPRAQYQIMPNITHPLVIRPQNFPQNIARCPPPFIAAPYASNRPYFHQHSQQHPPAPIPNMISSQQLTSMSQRQLSYLQSAYRVGILATETLGKRVRDDRSLMRHSRTPPYEADVKWLLEIAIKLGKVDEYSWHVLKAVSSPFVLFDIIQSLINWLGHTGSLQYVNTFRSNILHPLIHQCHSLFSSYVLFQLMNITPSDYDDFISTLKTARTAFNLIPDGASLFTQLLINIKRAKSCKTEIWQLINSRFMDQ